MEGHNSKNLQDLLKFALKYEQNPERQYIDIDEDKKRFLDCVLKSMSVNVIGDFSNAIRVLQNSESTDEEKCEALELIQDYIDNIDFANTFVKIEGADILISCVRDGNKSVCISANNVVAEMCQINPFCQQYFLKYDIIKLLVGYLSRDDPEVVASALYALSALIRHFEPALVEFNKSDGLKHVIECLSSKSSRVFVKACFLLTTISSDFCLIKDECAKLGAFNKLQKNLRAIDDFDVEIEMTLKAMSVIVESPHCELKKEEIEHVVKILKEIAAKNEQLPQCEEIVSLSNLILAKLE